MENGNYLIDFTMSGGSGKAYIVSPAPLTVKDGKINVRLEWSSPNYDLMVVDGTEYKPVNESGNSVFEVDIDALDTDIPIKAETLAMSEPHMIDYTLRFNSSTLKSADSGANPAVWFCIGAAVVCAAAVAVITGRRRRNAK